MRASKARSKSSHVREIGGELGPAFESQSAPGGEGGAISQIVGRALSLRPRGAVGKDGLVVQSLSARLRVQLLARPIHPWDRDLAAEERGELFVQQCLKDVSIAIPKLFRSMPEIEEMEITVLDPRNKRAIIAGLVNRSDALTCSPNLSAGMKLRGMGLAYGRSNIGFERMDENPMLVLSAPERASIKAVSQK
jgi:hypothetical protein